MLTPATEEGFGEWAAVEGESVRGVSECRGVLTAESVRV